MAKTIQTELHIHEIKPSSFIYEEKRALTSEVCRDMIRRFETNKEQQYEGRIGQNQSRKATIKRSTDLGISGRDEGPGGGTSHHQRVVAHDSPLTGARPLPGQLRI